jgi:glycosyltransferase involved in cell wall biosynthesis
MKISVLMCVRNVELYIENCIRSILTQSITDFELIIVDDNSTDATLSIIKKTNDNRVKIIQNDNRLGISPSRNKGVKQATGDYLFFTDGDCTVSRDWLKQGLKNFEDPNVVGVEGKIIYVSQDYKPTYSDNIQENRHGGNYMTGNIAYRRAVVEAVGGFDEALTYLEDRDLGFRISKLGKISFSTEMLVTHPKVTLTPKTYIKRASNNVNRVRIFKKTGIGDFFIWRVYCPVDLAKIICPPLILGTLFTKRFKTSQDYNLLPYSYVGYIRERINLWKASIEEKVFLI